MLGVFAHPDDEQLMTGTFAQAAADGIRTGLVCATKGECGQIHPESGATPETMAEVREAELRAACVVAGIKHLWFLDYRDTGWFDSPDNKHPDAFCNADEEAALERLVRIVRDFKPTVMVTFDKTGGYGHLDHLMIHKLTTSAFYAAGDPAKFPDVGEPWQVARVYYSSFARSATVNFARRLREVDPDSDFAQLDFSNMGLPDEEITNALDVSSWADLKRQSLSSHLTQKGDQERFARMSKDLGVSFVDTEHFALGVGVPLPDGPVLNKSLFAGL
ncbi:MAG: PIG-L family deacetylase [Chloroflexia bacterium]